MSFAVDAKIGEQSVSDSNADEELLGRFVQTKDRAAFEQLMRRYQHEIYNYLRRYLGNDELAEDAFQLTFVKVFKKAESFDLSRRFRPWLYGVATHQAIDLQRREKRHPLQSLDAGLGTDEQRVSSQASSLEDYRQCDHDPLEREELKRNMAEAIEEVGEPGRSALQLVYLQGLPYREAAEALDVPVGTVKSRVHSAIRKLSAIWQRKSEQSA